MITDIMPLVDELHKLRNENAILRGSLNEQAVRMDQLISAGAAQPAWVTVKISPVELALRSESGQANYLRSELLRWLMECVQYAKDHGFEPPVNSPVSLGSYDYTMEVKLYSDH